MIAALKTPRSLPRYRVGVDTIDLDAVTAKGICVANVPDYCKDEVADHALALLLGWTRKVVIANQYVKNGKCDFNVTRPARMHRSTSESDMLRVKEKIAPLVAE